MLADKGVDFFVKIITGETKQLSYLFIKFAFVFLGNFFHHYFRHQRT